MFLSKPTSLSQGTLRAPFLIVLLSLLTIAGPADDLLWSSIDSGGGRVEKDSGQDHLDAVAGQPDAVRLTSTSNVMQAGVLVHGSRSYPASEPYTVLDSEDLNSFPDSTTATPYTSIGGAVFEQIVSNYGHKLRKGRIRGNLDLAQGDLTSIRFHEPRPNYRVGFDLRIESLPNPPDPLAGFNSTIAIWIHESQNPGRAFVVITDDLFKNTRMEYRKAGYTPVSIQPDTGITSWDPYTTIDWRQWHRIESTTVEVNGIVYVYLTIDGRLYRVFKSSDFADSAHRVTWYKDVDVLNDPIEYSYSYGRIEVSGDYVVEIDNLVMDNVPGYEGKGAKKDGVDITSADRWEWDTEMVGNHHEFLNESFVYAPSAGEEFLQRYRITDSNHFVHDATNQTLQAAGGGGSGGDVDARRIEVLRPPVLHDYNVSVTYDYPADYTGGVESIVFRRQYSDFSYTDPAAAYRPAGDPSSTADFSRDRHYRLYTEDKFRTVKLSVTSDQYPSGYELGTWNLEQLPGISSAGAVVPVRVKVCTYGRIIECYVNGLLALHWEAPAAHRMVLYGGTQLWFDPQSTAIVDDLLVETDYYFWRKRGDKLVYRGQPSIAHGFNRGSLTPENFGRVLKEYAEWNETPGTCDDGLNWIERYENNYFQTATLAGSRRIRIFPRGGFIVVDESTEPVIDAKTKHYFEAGAIQGQRTQAITPRSSDCWRYPDFPCTFDWGFDLGGIGKEGLWTPLTYSLSFGSYFSDWSAYWDETNSRPCGVYYGTDPDIPAPIPMSDIVLYTEAIVRAARRHDVFLTFAMIDDASVTPQMPYGPATGPTTQVQYDRRAVEFPEIRQFSVETFAGWFGPFSDEPILHSIQHHSEPIAYKYLPELAGHRWYDAGLATVAAHFVDMNRLLWDLDPDVSLSEESEGQGNTIDWWSIVEKPQKQLIASGLSPDEYYYSGDSITNQTVTSYSDPTKSYTFHLLEAYSKAHIYFATLDQLRDDYIDKARQPVAQGGGDLANKVPIVVDEINLFHSAGPDGDLPNQCHLEGVPTRLDLDHPGETSSGRFFNGFWRKDTGYYSWREDHIDSIRDLPDDEYGRSTFNPWASYIDETDRYVWFKPYFASLINHTVAHSGYSDLPITWWSLATDPYIAASGEEGDEALQREANRYPRDVSDAEERLWATWHVLRGDERGSAAGYSHPHHRYYLEEMNLYYGTEQP